MITMAKRIKTAVTKNSCNYYIIDDFTNPSTKKRSTFVYERLGNIEKKIDLRQKMMRMTYFLQVSLMS